MQPTILIFDSGVGGLSIYRDVKSLLPDAHYLYCFDNAFFPYSEKEENAVIARTEQILAKMAEIYPIDLAIIACNTASTASLPHIRAHFDFPIVGTVPAIKPAAEISQTKVIGLLATKGTIQRPYVFDLIKQHAPDCQIEMLGSTQLVEMVEAKLNGQTFSQADWDAVVAPWRKLTQLDTVILGCTHFPLVKHELMAALPNVKFWMDTGLPIARRTQHLLQTQKTASNHAKPAHALAFCTHKPEDFAVRHTVMQSWGFADLLHLEAALPNLTSSQ